MDDLLSPTDLETLERLIGCMMIAGIDGRAMYIGADSPQKVATAQRKLSALAKHFVSFYRYSVMI